MPAQPADIPAKSGRHFSADFWKFWAGQSISTLGSSITGFALPLLIFKLTHSPLNLAFTVFAYLLPYLLFGLVIGAWVDRINRRRLMIFTDLLRAMVIALIPVAAFFNLLSVWEIYAAAFINSALTICFDAANFAAVPSMVDADDLVIANGRIQAGYSTAGVVGPLVAGVLLVVLPLPALLLFDAFSFLISAGSLALIATSFNAGDDEKKTSTSIRQDIIEGLRYVSSHPILRWLLLLLLLINFIAPTAGVQLVLFAKDWLHASDSQVGLLYSAGSVGVVVLSLTAGQLRKRLSFSKVALGATLLEGAMNVCMALNHGYWVALPIWAVRAGATVLFTINAYSLAQAIVPNRLLGRVIIFTRVLTWSTAPIGALLGGFVIEWTQNVAVVYGGVGILLCLIAIVFSFTPLGRTERYLPQE